MFVVPERPGVLIYWLFIYGPLLLPEQLCYGIYYAHVIKHELNSAVVFIMHI
jgi:hypothetical protein